MGILTSWLFRIEPPIQIVPVLNKIIFFSIKLIYIAIYILLRGSLRIVVGKRKRDKFLAKTGLKFDYDLELNFAFSVINFSHQLSRLLRYGNSLEFKITVPKYQYKAYCPVNKQDFVNLTVREDEIIKNLNVRQGDTVVDVGAHIGRYTLIASKCVDSFGRVVAIEPDPTNFELLNRNIKLNNLSNVTTLNCAAYSKQANIRLYLPEGLAAGKSIYETVIKDRAPTKKFVVVPAERLDLLLASAQISHRRVNWIKIDVEGSELEVLKGATETLSQSRNISLLIEVHNLSEDNNLYQPIKEFLESRCFKITFEMAHESGERHIIATKY